MAKAKTIWTSGTRKTAAASLKMKVEPGQCIINEEEALEYFPLETQQIRLFYPFEVTEVEPSKFDISIKVKGGGKLGQLGAIRLALARALQEYNPKLRAALKKAGLLTRDERMKERKKYGHKRARKSPQYSKR